MGSDRHTRYWSAFAVLALFALTEVFYLRQGIPMGTRTLAGLDYEELHIRRIRFARAALFGIRHTLPAWYPHEVLGSPFAANLQSFPWIPTDLLLLPLDPSIAYAVAIALSAPAGRSPAPDISRRAFWRGICLCWIHPAAVDYSRPSSDEISLRTTSDRPRFVHVLEADDFGWTTTVDGAGAPLVSPEFNESFTLNATNTSSVTPEPGSYAALILAFGGVMLVARSRRAKQSA